MWKNIQNIDYQLNLLCSTNLLNILKYDNTIHIYIHELIHLNSKNYHKI